MKGPLERQAHQFLWSQGRDLVEGARNSNALDLFDDLKTQFDDGKTTTPKAWTQIKNETAVDLFELVSAGSAAVKSVEFSIEAIKEMGRGLQDTDFIVRSRTYFDEREAGHSPAQIWDISKNEFLALALTSLMGANITEARMGENGISISYEQATDAAEADLLNKWINMAMVAVTYMDVPQPVTILPMTEGTQVARIVIPAGVLGEVLNGQRSLRQAIAAIEVGER